MNEFKPKYTEEEERLLAVLSLVGVEKVIDKIAGVSNDLLISLQLSRAKGTPRIVWLGASLGNWNDRRHGTHDKRADASLRWRLIDRIAGWLYVHGERPQTGRPS